MLLQEYGGHYNQHSQQVSAALYHAVLLQGIAVGNRDADADGVEYVYAWQHVGRRIRTV